MKVNFFLKKSEILFTLNKILLLSIYNLDKNGNHLYAVHALWNCCIMGLLKPNSAVYIFCIIIFGILLLDLFGTSINCTDIIGVPKISRISTNKF